MEGEQGGCEGRGSRVGVRGGGGEGEQGGCEGRGSRVGGRGGGAGWV